MFPTEGMSLQSLIYHLDVPDTDYWYDFECNAARKIIDEHDDEIFRQLLTEWHKWPIARQEHLAYILGEGTSARELVLIKEMLTSEHADVAYRAKEALVDFTSET